MIGRYDWLRSIRSKRNDLYWRIPMISLAKASVKIESLDIFIFPSWF
jgi:hypothetical protein